MSQRFGGGADGDCAAHHNYVLCAGNAARGTLSSDGDPQTYNGVAPRGAPFRFVTVWLDAASGWNIGTVVKDAPRQTLASILDGVSNTLASSEVIKGRDGTMMDGSVAFDRRGYTHWGDACSFTTLYTPNNAAPDRFDNGSRCATRPRSRVPSVGHRTTSSPAADTPAA